MSDSAKPTVRVRQVRSGLGRKKDQRQTLVGLGLGKLRAGARAGGHAFGARDDQPGQAPRSRWRSRSEAERDPGQSRGAPEVEAAGARHRLGQGQDVGQGRQGSEGARGRGAERVRGRPAADLPAAAEARVPQHRSARNMRRSTSGPSRRRCSRASWWPTRRSPRRRSRSRAWCGSASGRAFGCWRRARSSKQCGSRYPAPRRPQSPRSRRPAGRSRRRPRQRQRPQPPERLCPAARGIIIGAIGDR